jgi:hypothetical protein
MSCSSTAKPADRAYSETVNVPGVSADDLFTRANLWFTDSFQGPDASKITIPGFNIPEKSRVIASDRNTGSIKGNYTFLTYMRAMPGVFQIWLIYSTVELQVSDGQYTLTFSDPINGAASYITSEGRWIYSPTSPLSRDYVEATHNVWHDLSSALRDTVGGTLAD